MYMGSGGAPEGVLAAAALKCMGGQMLGRLLFRNDDERAFEDSNSCDHTYGNHAEQDAEDDAGALAHGRSASSICVRCTPLHRNAVP
jgi:fructose-1,6-bisphosphatase/sedoheptulose 1,7-bisphosphatase-like protein